MQRQGKIPATFIDLIHLTAKNEQISKQYFMNAFYARYKKEINRSIAGTLLGGTAGFLYYYYFGCTNGCALQGNPYLMTGYGIMVGVTLLFPGKKKTEPAEEKGSNSAG